MFVSCFPRVLECAWLFGRMLCVVHLQHFPSQDHASEKGKGE
jgi:hypothetical protein